MNVGPSSAAEKTVEFMAPPPLPAPSAPPQSASVAPSGTLSPSIKNTKFFGVQDFFGPAPSVDKVESEQEEEKDQDLDLDLKL
ncbi:hypothetical protein ACET3Z_016594 [Daucus carota]